MSRAERKRRRDKLFVEIFNYFENLTNEYMNKNKGSVPVQELWSKTVKHFYKQVENNPTEKGFVRNVIFEVKSYLVKGLKEAENK